MYKQILVATNTSNDGAATTREAGRLARAMGADIAAINADQPTRDRWRAILLEAEAGAHDLIVLDAHEPGAGSDGVGTVCERVARRAAVDMLVTRQPVRSLCDGPIVVGLDGSPRSFGGLLTALELARLAEVEVHTVAVFDPSDPWPSSRCQAELDAGRRLAREAGVTVVSRLLAGEPYRALLRVVDAVEPSLLVVGRTGIHADETLTMGGNTQRLLSLAECNLLVSVRRAAMPLTQALYRPDDRCHGSA